MPSFSFRELLIIGVVVVLLFGKDLPAVAKKVGEMLR